jgi:hypothetical protein
MHTDLSIHLSEQAFSLLANEASAAGTTPAELAAALVEKAYAADSSASVIAAGKGFVQCFGSVDLGKPIGLANGDIDADLAQAYGTSAPTR